MSDFGTFLGRPGTPLGTLGEPKKSLKIDFLLKKGIPNVIFRGFLCIKLVFTLFARFSVDFSRKTDGKSMEKTMCFFVSSLVFFSMATLTKHCILECESYFFIFRVFVFFSKKNVKKRAPKSRPHFSLKNHPKVVPGDPFWDRKRTRINVGGIKNPKIPKKNRFCAEKFFEYFFNSKKLLGPI